MELTCQEIEVWYVLPAIRREIAKVLIEKHEFNQKEAAEFLGVTKAAVSQWLSKKRGNEDVINETIRKKIEKSVLSLLKNKDSMPREISLLCKEVTKNKLTCKIHKSHSKNVGNCEICRT